MDAAAAAASHGGVRQQVFAFGNVGLRETAAKWKGVVGGEGRFKMISALECASPQREPRRGLQMAQDAARVPAVDASDDRTDPTAFPSAVLLSSLSGVAASIVKLDAGLGHTLALVGGGDVLAWGCGRDGRLGTGPGAADEQLEPVKVDCGAPIQDVAAGGAHSLALRHDGVVLSWGSNSDGQLGTGGLQPSDRPTPVVTAGLPPIVAVAAGQAHSVMLGATGHVYCCGRGREGQLGRPAAVQCAPHLITMISAQRVTDVAAAAHVTALRAENGAVWVCGDGTSGMLGQGDTKSRTTPQCMLLEHQRMDEAQAEVVSTAGVPRYGTAESYYYPAKLFKPPAPIEPSAAVVDMALGRGHSVLCDASGRVFCVGLNAKGQLGLGLTGEKGLRRPRQLSVAPPPGQPPQEDCGDGAACESVVAGAAFSAAVSQGHLYVWGSLMHAPPVPAKAGPPPPRAREDIGGPGPVLVPPEAFGCAEAKVTGVAACGAALYVFVETPAVTACP